MSVVVKGVCMSIVPLSSEHIPVEACPSVVERGRVTPHCFCRSRGSFFGLSLKFATTFIACRQS